MRMETTRSHTQARRKVSIIVVSGPDASGKTTFCRKLSTKLPCGYIPLQGFHMLSYLLVRTIRILLELIHPRAYFLKKSSLLDHPYIFSLYVKLLPLPYILEKASLMLKYLLITIRLFFKQCLIIDEGFINTLANYMEVFTRVRDHKVRQYGVSLATTLLILYDTISKRYNTLTIYLDVDDSLQIRRVLFRRRPITTLNGLLRHRRYLEVAKELCERILGLTIHEVHVRSS